MKDIWVISDTHFHHQNVLSFKNKDGDLIRGSRFSSVDEMDEYMLECWNSTIKPGDLVYHLGDVFIGPKDRFEEFWPKLHGSKRLVVGNHDDVKYFSKGGFFNKVMLWRLFKEENLLLTHVPVHPSGLHGSIINVHGHTHHNGSPQGPYRSVCVEMIDYKPIHIEELSQHATRSIS
jgi:calcineurin-like phosphoesterase family protein